MADYGHTRTDIMLTDLENRIYKEYAQASREVKKKLDDYLRRYRIKDEIKRKQVKAGEITREEYIRWKTGQIAVGKRWEEMRQTLAEDWNNTNRIAASMVREFTYEVYALNHNFGTFEVEKGSAIDTSYTLYDKHTVERLIRDNPDMLPPPGKKTSERIRKGLDVKWNNQLIQSVMTQGILQGESIPQIAKRLAVSVGDSNRKSAIRNARTMTTGAENAGRVDSYKRAQGMGIKMKEVWVATLDGRTRHSHRQLDGEKIEVGKTFSNGCRFPGDPSGPAWEVYNCRCTLIGQVDGINFDLSDKSMRNNYKLGGMSYEQWKNEHSKKRGRVVEIRSIDAQIGSARTVEEINDIMNNNGWFRVIDRTKTSNLHYDRSVMKWVWDEEKYTEQSMADLTGCDLDSAKSIAASYNQVFTKYPKLKGRFDAPDAKPVGMNSNTYAWCHIRANGQVQVNPGPERYGNWNKIQSSYEKDVMSRWHPQGTTAESIVTHEIGHAIDGLLAREGIKGGVTASGEYRYASSTMRNAIMSRAAKKDETIAEYWNAKDWNGKTDKYQQAYAIEKSVSRYASKDPQEWFAECFAEYITSANPRPVATEFGKQLETLIEKLK